MAARRRRNAAAAKAAARRAARLKGGREGGGGGLGESAAVFEDIADAPFGVEEFFGEGFIEFLAEAADVDVDDVGVAVEVHVPDLFGDEGAGEDFAGAAGEECEEGEFLGAEVETFAGAGGLVADEIDFEIGDGEEIGLACAGAAEDGADAGEEFREGEGFDEVIVGAEFEAFDAVFDGIAGGEEEDGDGGAGAAEFLEDGPAVEAGEHDVEDDEGVLVGAGEVEGIEAAGGDVQQEAAFGEAFLEVEDGVGIIFNEEDFHAGALYGVDFGAREVWAQGGAGAKKVTHGWRASRGWQVLWMPVYPGSLFQFLTLVVSAGW